MIESIAWSLLALIVLVFAGYPMAVLAIARLWPPRPYYSPSYRPDMSLNLSVIVCAHNEERHIAAKLESVLASSAYYGGSVQVIVADDGSTDRTPEMLRHFAEKGVEVLVLPRGGKAAALNTAVAQAHGDIFVLSDADTLFDDSTIEQLMAPFADQATGAVAGHVVPVGKGGTKLSHGADGVFRRYESAIRLAEDRIFGTISADGGPLAIRRQLMPRVPSDGTDDFHISTAAPAAGMRIAFAPHAIARELPLNSGRKSLKRRIRITVRGLTALFRRRALLNPVQHGGYAIGLFFHKLARRFAPLLVLPFAACALFLALDGEPFWICIAAGMFAITTLVLLGWAMESRIPKPLRAPYLMSLHLFGLCFGVVLYLSGKRYAQWTPTSGQ